MARPSGTSRRGLLIGLAGLAGIAWGWQRYIHRDRAPEIEPIPGLPGWRRVAFEGVTTPGGNATSAVFAGLGDTSDVTALSPDRLCPVLFRDAGPEIVPLAMFTDAFCPFCREMDARLAARPETVTWLDLPLLGPASERAARAALAAELQGNRSFRSRMMTGPFRPTREAIAALAQATGADAPRLFADMDSAAVTDRLAEVRAAAATLGVFGTPTLVVSQLLAAGNLSSETIDRLIEDELRQPGPSC